MKETSSKDAKDNINCQWYSLSLSGSELEISEQSRASLTRRDARCCVTVCATDVHLSESHSKLSLARPLCKLVLDAMVAVRYPTVYTAELLRVMLCVIGLSVSVRPWQCVTGIQPESMVGVVKGGEEDQDEAAGSNAAEMKLQHRYCATSPSLRPHVQRARARTAANPSSRLPDSTPCPYSSDRKLRL